MQNDINESRTKKFHNVEEIIDEINKDLESGGVILNRHGVSLNNDNRLDSVTVDTVLVKKKNERKVYSIDDLSLTIYVFEPEVDEYMTRHFGKPVNLTSTNSAFEACEKEADLSSKKDTQSLEDLFSKSTEEIVDGLVSAADGDHELALKNLEDYMNTHDGFNRNVISAHQQLQNKVESMKNSKFNKMIDEALNNFNKDPKYYLIYNTWTGPYGDDKEVIEIPVGDDLEYAKEQCRELSIKLNKLVDVLEKETGKQLVRFINGVETDLSNKPIKK